MTDVSLISCVLIAPHSDFKLITFSLQSIKDTSCWLVFSDASSVSLALLGILSLGRLP